MVSLRFRYRNRLCAKVEKKIKKAWVGPYLKFFGKEMQHIIFYAHVHACIPSYTDKEWKGIAVNSEAVCLWLVDRSYDRNKNSVLFISKVRF